ncbi:MAG: nickel-dependent hydrogenase large subunit [Rhodospirillales bacterium]|nr:nickel-dependent hydrogenase large subunit [Rhodospirillales bacterium]
MSLTWITGGSDKIEGCAPWPRFIVNDGAWLRAGDGLRDGRIALLGFWGERDAVHLALSNPALDTISVITRLCPDRRFPSIAASFSPASRLERTIGDLWGVFADGSPDPRPWLDHGCWPAAPAGVNPPRDASAPYPFLAVEGESLHQIPVGPVHAGIIEPGHFRFTASGETIVRLEERLGYVHKGIERLMQGAEIDTGARLAGRISGDSTVAYAIAFARAVESASGTVVPPRAHWLRALMAEMERIANHLGDVGAICNDAAFAAMLAPCAVLREHVLRTAGLCFGHRLMMDKVVPGGVAVDLGSDSIAAIKTLVSEIRQHLPDLIHLYDNTTSLQDRTVRTGVLRPDFAAFFGCGGPIGRASGRAVDVRRRPGYPPYDELSFDVIERQDGDVNARVWVRIEEIKQSLALISQILSRPPVGKTMTALAAPPASGGEGLALIEGFRGDIMVWVRLRADGKIDRCHPRDPSWFQWPLLEAVIEGNIVADFPLCNKSFNCSYCGHDL